MGHPMQEKGGRLDEAGIKDIINGFGIPIQAGLLL